MVGSKESKEPGPLRQRRTQRAPSSTQPALERSVPDPFEGKKDPQRDDLTEPQGGQGLFGPVLHGIVYPIEQLTDKVLGRHGALLGLQRCRNPKMGDST